MLKMKSPLDISVSCFRNYNSPDDPKPVNLLTWLRSDKYRNQVEAIRSTDDKKKRDRLKTKLPAITPSGTFDRRSSDAIIQHSGLMQIDIDGPDHEHVANFDELKRHICKLPEIAYCGLSVSGRGYWGLVPIQHPEKHVSHFRALERAFKRYDIVIDPSCKDVSRLRGYSFDPDGYFNNEARLFTLLDDPKPIRVHRSPGSNTRSQVELLVSQIQSQKIDITQGYETWLKIGFALADEFGENGREMFHAVSHFHQEYSERETDRQFKKCIRGNGQGVTIASFFHICKEYGIAAGVNHSGAAGRKEDAKHEICSSVKLNEKGYPASWDEVEAPVPGSDEDREAIRYVKNEVDAPELQRLMDGDPMLEKIVQDFDCELIPN